MLPSRSTYKPCGTWISPSPNALTRLPFASNFRIDGRLEPTHELAPQRSATQMLTPSLSMPTPLVDPQVRPSGILAQPTTVSYGLGCLFVGSAAGTPAGCCAWRAAANVSSAALLGIMKVIRLTVPFRSGDCNHNPRRG